ncbi:MAG: zinc ribbon domain-containing protein [Desulfuromonadales bacterium]|nr:zinc ribbon domain-containing protein [Desulfuromonadales bacterium]
MPIFEYQCKHCGQTIEKIKRIPPAEVPCPACSKPAVRTVSLTSAAASGGNGSCSIPAGSGFT